MAQVHSCCDASAVNRLDCARHCARFSIHGVNMAPVIRFGPGGRETLPRHRLACHLACTLPCFYRACPLLGPCQCHACMKLASVFVQRDHTDKKDAPTRANTDKRRPGRSPFPSPPPSFPVWSPPATLCFPRSATCSMRVAPWLARPLALSLSLSRRAKQGEWVAGRRPGPCKVQRYPLTKKPPPPPPP